MAKETLIRISVYPHIRKYLLHHYTEGVLNPSVRGGLSTLLINLLQPVPKIDPAGYKPPLRVKYGETYSFRMTPHLLGKYGNYISSDNVRRFNELVLDLIHGELYRLVTLMAELNYNTDQAIRKFQELYDFSEDELPFENLKRWYYRERSRKCLRVVHNATESEASDMLVLTYYEEKQDPEIEPAA